MTEAAIRRSREAISKGRFADAIQILEPLFLDGCEEPDVLLYLGMAYLQIERPDSAVDVLERAAEQVEDHCILDMLLGRAYTATGCFDSAEIYLERAITREPELVEAWIDLGKVLYFSHEYGEAARVLEDAVIRFPDNRALHSIRAMSLYRLGDYTEATQEWGALCQVDPKNLKYVTTYAYSLLMLDRLNEALPYVEKAKSIDSTSYRTVILDAELSFRRGEPDLAYSRFREALELSPDSLEALGRLAVIESERGNEAQSKRYLELAEALVQEEPSSWQRLCDSYRLMEKHDRLIDCLTYATRKDQGCAAAWIHLAKEYMQQGLVEEAHYAWRESFTIRGYIKLHCSDCDTYFKVPYEDNSDYEPFDHAECIYCNSPLPMPDSLADI